MKQRNLCTTHNEALTIMKTIILKTVKTWVYLAAVVVVTATGCTQQKTVEGVTAAQMDSVSYLIGVNYGKHLKETNLDQLCLKAVMQGVQDELNNKEPRFQMDSTQYETMVKDFKLKSNVQAGKKFFENNKKQDGVVELPDGLQYKILTEGTGATPAAEDTVEVHYKGVLLDGREFDSSYKRNSTSKFALNRVIKGWTEGFQYLKEGSKAILYIPSDLAYGERQRGPMISPGSTLIFEVELFKVMKVVPVE